MPGLIGCRCVCVLCKSVYLQLFVFVQGRHENLFWLEPHMFMHLCMCKGAQYQCVYKQEFGLCLCTVVYTVCLQQCANVWVYDRKLMLICLSVCVCMKLLSVCVCV